MLATDNEYEALVQFLYLAPVGLAQTSLDGEIVMLNPVSAQLLMPLSRDGNLANLFAALEHVAPDLRHLVAEFHQPYGHICDAMRIQISAGSARFDAQFLSLSLLKLDDHRLMAVLDDISLQVKRERLLKQNEAWLNAVLTGISDYALISLDAHGRIDNWNPSIGRVTGFPCEAVLGKSYALFYPDDATTPDRIHDRLVEADANGWSLDDGWRMKADGTRFWGSAMIAPLHDRDDATSSARAREANIVQPGYCLVIRDITEMRAASEAHRMATAYDHLTGIANRRAFFESAELEVEGWKRAPRPLSLNVFDADHFKRINDVHGYPAGDAVLLHLAGLFASTFRQIDVVARIGGEEFAVLLPSTALAGAAAVAARLCELVCAHSVGFDGQTIAYTVSAGVATMGADVHSLEVLMKRADKALYQAKAEGRNRVVCWSAV